ncbi:MAG: thiamine-phosphate kinase [Thermoplasmata archaeon]|nr:thiamine-phosphate kinase [Thermoplasmata archaeon]
MTGAIRERAFHAWLRRTLPSTLTPRLPMGDDVAAISLGRSRYALLTTDALSEGTHFLRDSPPEAIGAAAIGASLSDLASKGGQPRAALMDLLVPSQTPQRWCERVTSGAQAMCARHGAEIVGGDTKPARGRSVVGTMFGLRRGTHLPARRDALAGDIVVTTGSVGRGGVAAQALRNPRPSQAELTALLDIEPRVVEGAALAGHARAMTDSSDGLAEAVRLIAEASATRIVIDEARIPWAPRVNRIAPDRGARRSIGFYGGDYELVATIPPRHLGSAHAAVDRVGGRLSEIGRVHPGKGAWLVPETGGRQFPLRAPGWDPFSRRLPA